MSFPWPRTVWRIRAIDQVSASLDVQVVVETTAPAVIAAIENAADAHGISMERVSVANDRRMEP